MIDAVIGAVYRQAMASQGYTDWLNAGRPYALIRPAAAVQAALRGYGLTVYDYPNAEHLKANTPEDHTPFSVTGWPGQNRRWKARALDVMPRDGSTAARRENAGIARQLIADRDAGVPGAMWIKYINWTDEDGACRQERWMAPWDPLVRTTRSSSDKGHIHISGRSDADDDARADDYDPYARMQGAEMALDLGTPVGWTKQFMDPAKDYPLWLGGSFSAQFQYVREVGYFTWLLAKQNAAVLAIIAAKVDIDADELAAIERAAQAGARAAFAEQQEALISAVVAAVGEAASDAGARVSERDIEAAVRRVFADAGQSDGDAPALPATAGPKA